MNQQEIFNAVVKHMARQGAPAKSEDGTCSYRGAEKDGKQTSCAVGCLIPDDMYLEEMEANTIYTLLRYAEAYNIKLPEHITDPANTPLLRQLQKVHDGHDDWVEDWPKMSEKLRFIAAGFNLCGSRVWDFDQAMANRETEEQRNARQVKIRECW